MNTITPIQTRFDGRFFRSRLEAKTAVFFKCIGTEYVHEPEGYKLGRLFYLPDFFLPDVYVRDSHEKGWFIEVKPKGISNLKLTLLSQQTGIAGLLMAGHNVRHNHHFQLGHYPDSSMNFRKCVDCDAVKIGYGYIHATCQNCGGYCCDRIVIEAVNAANSARFEYAQKMAA